MFGLDENQKVRNRFEFPANNLVITSIDIQSVEPVDQRTRDALQKSVQLAIEITTNSEEAGVFCELHYIHVYCDHRLTFLQNSVRQFSNGEALHYEVDSIAIATLFI